MILAIGAVLGGLGLISILTRQTLLGVLIGIYLAVLGAGLALLGTGVGQGYALMMLIAGHLWLFAGFGVSARIFSIHGDLKMSRLRELKR